MRRFYIIVISLIITSFIPLHDVKAGEVASVSLLTCSPGDEVYSFFGHTAIRYRNPDKKMDLVFNYGVFDFAEPNFVGKFVLGETDYLLGITEYPYFAQEYIMRGSRVDEQLLALDSAQSERLFGLLKENYRPKNRKYRYNYFYNNCTTKARDIIEEALGDGCKVNYNYTEESASWRDVVHRFTAVSPWYSFGIDLLLGADADAAPGARALQFIPSTLMRDFSGASIVCGDSVRPLVGDNRVVVEGDGVSLQKSIFTPDLCFALLFLIVVMLTFWGYGKVRLLWGIDVLLMLVQGVAGLLVAFMVLFSQHPTVGRNMLVIFLNPLPLIILPIYIYDMIKGRKPKIMWLQLAMVSFFLAASPLMTQYFPLPVYLFASTLLVRSLFVIYRQR